MHVEPLLPQPPVATITACTSKQVERAFVDADADATANASSSIQPPAVATEAAAVPEQAAAAPEPPSILYSPSVSQPSQTIGGNDHGYPSDDEHKTLELLTPPPPPSTDAPSAIDEISRLPSSFSESSADEENRESVAVSGGVGDGGNDDTFAAALSLVEDGLVVKGEGAAGAQEKPRGNFRNDRGAAAEAFGDGDRDDLSVPSRTSRVAEGRAGHATRPTQLKLADDDRLAATLPDLRLVASPAGEEVDVFAATRAAVRARLASRGSVLGSAKRASTPAGRWSDDGGVPVGVMASPRYWESASASARTAFDRETRFLTSQM